METTQEINYEAEIDRILNKGLVEPSILIVGIGGGATNIVTYLYEKGVDRGKVIAINTDETALMNASVDKRVLIGRVITEGSDAGGFPEVAEKCAEIGRDALESLIEGVDIVFLVTCLGGGTGTGTTPLIAELASEYGKIVSCIAIAPFSVENRVEIGAALAKIKEFASPTIVINNDRLLDICPDIAFNEALNVINRLVFKTVKTVTETIDRKYLLSVVREETASMVRDVEALNAGEEQHSFVSPEGINAIYASHFNPVGETSIPPMYGLNPPTRQFEPPGVGGGPSGPFGF